MIQIIGRLTAPPAGGWSRLAGCPVLLAAFGGECRRGDTRRLFGAMLARIAALPLPTRQASDCSMPILAAREA